MASLQILAKAEVLGCPIDAAYQKTETKSTTIVYGKSDPLNPKKKTLTDLTNEFGNVFTVEDLSKSLPATLTNITDSIEYSLNQVFYLKQTDVLPPNATQEQIDQVKESKPGEYALWLELHAPGLIDGWPIDVDSVSVKVWSTKNPKVLEDMKINEMQQLLDYAGASQSVS